MSFHSRAVLRKIALGALLALLLVSNSFGQCEGLNVALVETSYPEQKQFLFAIEKLSNGSFETY
ncbi:MAG: hypothetical protein KDD53_11870, partial [Bdellovibrionales bacterium]|nr:hypothetical protein [Bdellovibrionales bacterium]